MIHTLVIISLFIWIIIFFLPWKPWSTNERFDSCDTSRDLETEDVTVIIPARNEASSLKITLPTVLAQSESLKIVLVDDCSNDETAKVAKRILGNRGKVIKGAPLPEGWCGKLWALEQGFKHVHTKFVLLVDADIALKDKVISSALSFMRRNKIDFFSLMAHLQMHRPIERLFLPAFVYFFKLVYPFSLANKERSFVAAAAGGFVLAKTDAIRHAGAFSAIKDCIIDDCSLAKTVKRTGKKTFIGLTRCVKSIREYGRLTTIWRMVERTAYTQLRYNPFLLLLTTILMFIAFIIPVIGLVTGSSLTLVMSFCALFVISISYMPVLKYYAVPIWIGFTLPFVATLYMAMTWSSALKYYLGRGISWKDRQYFK